MNIDDLLFQYNKAIEKEKILEGQKQLLQKQLDDKLNELGMTYKEVLSKEALLSKKLNEVIPKIKDYIQKVEFKQQETEEFLL